MSESTAKPSRLVGPDGAPLSAAQAAGVTTNAEENSSGSAVQGTVAGAGKAIVSTPQVQAPSPLTPLDMATALDMAGEKVFAIGRLFYDFGTEARLDYFVYEIAAWRDCLVDRGDPTFGPNRDKAGDIAAPYNPEVLVRFLLNLAPGETASPNPLENMADANALIWTLTIDGVPIYALDTRGAYGSDIFTTFVGILWYQEVSEQPPEQQDTLVRGGEEGPQPSSSDYPPPGRFTRVSCSSASFNWRNRSPASSAKWSARSASPN